MQMKSERLGTMYITNTYYSYRLYGIIIADLILMIYYGYSYIASKKHIATTT